MSRSRGESLTKWHLLGVFLLAVALAILAFGLYSYEQQVREEQKQRLRERAR